MSLPLVGVTPDVKWIDGQPFHAVGDKYLRALVEVSELTPLVIPALSESIDLARLITKLDGVLFTGSPSNVHPERYGVTASAEHEPYDLARDSLSFTLIQEVLKQGVPLLAICRGFQELNVALGGTLHAAVHHLPERFDHRAPQTEDRDVQYGQRHKVDFIPTGKFAALADELQISVNSLHRQGIATLAPDLVAEGVATDGTIEAVSVKNTDHFALGVQWHPEYKAAERPFSVRLFKAFGEAVKTYSKRR